MLISIVGSFFCICGGGPGIWSAPLGRARPFPSPNIDPEGTFLAGSMYSSCDCADGDECSVILNGSASALNSCVCAGSGAAS